MFVKYCTKNLYIGETIELKPVSDPQHLCDLIRNSLHEEEVRISSCELFIANSDIKLFVVVVFFFFFFSSCYCNCELNNAEQHFVNKVMVQF